MKRNARCAFQLAPQICELNRQGRRQRRENLLRDPFSQPLGKVAVDAGDLKCPLADAWIEFIQYSVAETRVVSPEDKVDEPLPLEKAHASWMDICPPIAQQQVIRNAGHMVVDPFDMRGGRGLHRSTNGELGCGSRMHRWRCMLSMLASLGSGRLKGRRRASYAIGTPRFNAHVSRPQTRPACVIMR